MSQATSVCKPCAGGPNGARWQFAQQPCACHQKKIYRKREFIGSETRLRVMPSRRPRMEREPFGFVGRRDSNEDLKRTLVSVAHKPASTKSKNKTHVWPKSDP